MTLDCFILTLFCGLCVITEVLSTKSAVSFETINSNYINVRKNNVVRLIGKLQISVSQLINCKLLIIFPDMFQTWHSMIFLRHEGARAQLTVNSTID